MYEKDVLIEFLSYRPEDSMPVLNRFAGLKRAIAHFDGGKKNFVYVPGTGTNRVVLVAHADTVWDKGYFPDFVSLYGEPLEKKKHKPVLRKGIVRQAGWKNRGIGADDRAGCAILWLLKDTGHSLLITDGEEHGQIGANHLMNQYTDLAKEINEHSYMIQLDRRNNRDYKTYSLPVSEEFIEYIEARTGYTNAGTTSRTDIIALCRRICGVNLSVGYLREHHSDETLDVEGWLNAYETVKTMIEGEQPQFLLTSVTEF